MPRPIARFAGLALGLSLALGAAPGCAGHSARSAQTVAPLPELVAERSPGVVRIEVPDGYGTGFVVDGSGVIATSYHVLAGAGSAEVVLDGDRRLPVTRVLASDELHDFVLLQVEASGLVSLPLGDSRAVRPGEPVITISSPFGMLDHTVTDGLVSSVRGADDLRLLQISAPISEGSSGGPLLNRRGEVIGMASLIVSGGQNVNFAIPVEYLQPMLRGGVPETMADFGRRTDEGAAELPTGVDLTLPSDVLDSCPEPSRRVIRAAVDDALRVATPLCNASSYEACYRIYEGAALGLTSGATDIEGCDRALDVLREATDRGRQMSDVAERSMWLRDALTATLAAIDGATPEVERAPATIGIPEEPITRQPTP